MKVKGYEIEPGANLQGANLREANLREADLQGANLREANLREADLREADLGGANLGGANLREANLREANLRGANLRGANLRGARGILQGPVCSTHPTFAIQHSDGIRILAGCRCFTVAEARKHWGPEHESKGNHRHKMLLGVSTLVAMAKLEGWTT